MKNHKITLSTSDVPEKLRNIPKPPKQLFVMGQFVNVLLSRPCVAVVGSRKVSPYGRTVTTQVTEELAKAGVVIISGLAFGVDSFSHIAALNGGGQTIAVLPCGLDMVYPAAHQGLARRIVEQGGALITEYPEGSRIYPVNFIARNRLIAALADAVLITEAAEKSGSLHTVRFALEQGKEVLAVPGNITSPTSVGANNLIKSGATPVTSASDVLYTLGLETAPEGRQRPHSDDPDEQKLLDMLYLGETDSAELHRKSGLDIARFNQVLTMLEIRGQARALGNNRWSVTER